MSSSSVSPIPKATATWSGENNSDDCEGTGGAGATDVSGDCCCGGSLLAGEGSTTGGRLCF
ncbi:MAG: hypothetical protein MK102_17735 [Fuerstiella sp.]|nr:hypothetical protein [Fuerstiella sp.]